MKVTYNMTKLKCPLVLCLFLSTGFLLVPWDMRVCGMGTPLHVTICRLWTEQPSLSGRCIDFHPECSPLMLKPSLWTQPGPQKFSFPGPLQEYWHTVLMITHEYSRVENLKICKPEFVCTQSERDQRPGRAKQRSSHVDVLIPHQVRWFLTISYSAEGYFVSHKRL